MTRDILWTVLDKLVRISRKSRTKIVFMGGIAVSLYSRPRATYDIDGIASLEDRELEKFLTSLQKSDFRFDRKKPIGFIQGLPFISFYYLPYKTYVDIFIARNEFQHEILKRAKRITIKGLDLYIISPEDLILVKLQAGREKDIEDVRGIIQENKTKLNYGYLRKWSRMLNVGSFLEDELESLGIKSKR